jgi:hypothetical protein
MQRRSSSPGCDEFDVLALVPGGDSGRSVITELPEIRSSIDFGHSGACA